MHNRKIYAVYLGLLLLMAACAPKHMARVEDLPEKPNPAEQQEANPEALKHFMDGQMYMNQGNFPMAVLEFQEALELDPKAGPIHSALAESYWNLGKAEKAESHLKQAISLDSTDIQAHELLANQYVMQKKYDLAQSQFQKLISLDPKKAVYVVALAELAKVSHDIDGAIRHYREAFTLDQQRLDLLEIAGTLALRTGKHETAESLYKQLVTIEPDHPHYLQTYIDLVTHLKHYQEGITLLEELNKSYGESSRRVAQIGLLAYGKKDSESAFNALNRAIELDPGNPDYPAMVVDLYMENGDFDSVIVHSDQYIIQFPKDPRGYVNRALAAMNLDNHEVAIKVLRPVSDTFSTIFSVQYLLGLGYNRLKEYEQAELYFQKAAIIRPDSRPVKHSLAILFDNTKRWVKSDSIYIELIQSDSSDAQAYNNYAYSLVERDVELNRALEMAKKATKLEPENSAYLDTIGWIYFKLKDVESAEKFIRDSVHRDNTNPVVLEHLGDILKYLEKNEEAKETYQRAFELDPTNNRLKEKAHSDQ